MIKRRGSMRPMTFTLMSIALAAGLLRGQDNIPTPSEEVTVETSRLAGHTIEAGRVPQATIVITRADIERSSAATVAELLAERPEIVFYDQVGNGREAVVDMRGFNEGTAAAVFLDDVRINESDDNRVLLSQIPIEWVSRIEIFKGSASSVLGGGALSGAIRIYTINGADRSRVAFEGGSYTTGRVRADIVRSRGAGVFTLDAGLERSDGFRQNGEAREGWLRAGTRRAAQNSLLDFSYAYSKTRYGSPGALRADELAADRYSAPFNLVDENEDGTHLLTGDLQLTRGGVTFKGNAFLRRNDADALTTGRNASVWGGFASEARNTTGGTTVQGTLPLLSQRGTLTAGAELSWARLNAEGFSTDAGGIRTAQASSTDTNENLQGLFVQLESKPIDGLTIVAGARYDRQSMHFEDGLSGYSADRNFDRVTYRLGTSVRWTAQTTSFLNWGTAFQTPTIIDLFAFPGFFSNPDLRPSTARTVEAGQRLAWGELSAEVSAFEVRVDDEVIFVLTDPINFIGMNENAGRSRRRGMDASVGWDGKTTSVRAAYSFMRARFQAGDFAGNLLVMVPENKLSLQLTHDLRPGFRLSGRVLYTGAQFVIGDETNSTDRLSAYTTVDLKACYTRHNWKIEGVIRNLLDNEYETRAITDGLATYYTPAPGINGYVTFGYEF